MTQCRFERRAGTTTHVEYGWIETTKARVGRAVRFLDTDQVWRIVELGTVWSEARVKAYERDYVTMATVTDAFKDGHGGRRLPTRPKG